MQLSNEYIKNMNFAFDVVDAPIPAWIPETYAQTGEDIIISGLLRARLEKQQRPLETASYVEIGANHPISTSNTFLLYQKYGCRGVLVEANPVLLADLRRVRSQDTVIHTAVSTSNEATLILHVGNAHELSSVNPNHVHSFGDFGGHGGIATEIEVPNIHINDLLAIHAPPQFDMLSIDCEGIDYDLLCALDFEKYKPFIIICEPSEHFMPGNREKMISLLESRSYNLEAITDVNLVFTHVAAF